MKLKVKQHEEWENYLHLHAVIHEKKSNVIEKVISN